MIYITFWMKISSAILFNDTNLLACLHFPLSCIISKSIWLTEDDNKNVGKDNYKQSFDSSDEIKQNNSFDYKNNVISQGKVTEKDFNFLSNLRAKNVNRLIIVNLNINSILKVQSYKFYN